MIKVLREGVHIDNRYQGYINFEPIYGSSTLIRTVPFSQNDEKGISPSKPKLVNILVDPSHIGVAKELTELLKKEGVQSEEIDYVFITHHHLDHASNMGSFKNAKIFIGDGYVLHERPTYMTYQDFSLLNLPKGFSILPTPGHTLESNSYVYEENGMRYICAGDAVREDVIREGAPTAKMNPDLYLQSLKKIFALADVIIPGHGRVIEGELKDELKVIVDRM